MDAALDAKVRAVALAGDVVEKEDDFFEAYRELATGVKALTDAGIDVVAVAGNHDVKVLPRLANDLLKFKLLGRGGQWESWTVEENSEEPSPSGVGRFPKSRCGKAPCRTGPLSASPASA